MIDSFIKLLTREDRVLESLLQWVIDKETKPLSSAFWKQRKERNMDDKQPQTSRKFGNDLKTLDQ